VEPEEEPESLGSLMSKLQTLDDMLHVPGLLQVRGPACIHVSVLVCVCMCVCVCV